MGDRLQFRISPPLVKYHTKNKITNRKTNTIATNTTASSSDFSTELIYNDNGNTSNNVTHVFCLINRISS